MGPTGFFDFRLSTFLLAERFKVIAMMTWRVANALIKERHLQTHLQNEKLSSSVGLLEELDRQKAFCDAEKPNVLVHIVMQAKVELSDFGVELDLHGTLTDTTGALRENGADLIATLESMIYGDIVLAVAHKESCALDTKTNRHFEKLGRVFYYHKSLFSSDREEFKL